jgi:hypothetical protein
MSLQQLTGGRFVLGAGVSGPQVMEGWHGVPFGRPIRVTRETKLGGPLSVRLDTIALMIELAGEISREPAV